jgi:hypothetical protein
MASKEPPLIRSSKAFSVEIPEGSSSAKSRRSDVVAGLDEGIAPSDPHFEALSLAEKTHVPHNESSFDAAVGLGIDQELSQPDLSYNPHSSGEQLVGIANDSLQDHLVGVAKDNLNDHLVGVATEGLKDSLVGVATEGLKDSLVGVANEGLKDRLVGIAKDGLQDHMAAIPQENLADNLASLPNDAIEDREVAVAEPATPIPLFVSADDDFPDDHMEIEEVPEVDPKGQALSDESLADHVIQVNVDKAALGDVQIPVSNATRSESANAQSATNRKPAVKKLPAVLTPEMIKMQEAELIAKQQKMEEFHGRVEAIRNTVNNINAKLDQIAPVESKPTSH